MAIAAGCIFNLQTDGTETHGAGFVTGASGTDYSKTIAASLPANNTVTGASSAGAGSTILTAQASADWVGNLLTPTAGTNTTLTAELRYQILSVVVGVSATVSTNYLGGAIFTGVASGVEFIVGGAGKFYNSATDDTLIENCVAGNTWYIKTGSHSVGAVTVSSSGNANARIRFLGYVSTHGDTPTYSQVPVLSPSGAWTGLSYHIYRYLRFTGATNPVFSTGSANSSIVEYCQFNSNTTSSTASAANGLASGYFRYCTFTNPSGIGLKLTFQMWVHNCYFTACYKGITSVVAYNSIIGNIFSGIANTHYEISNAAQVGVISNNTFYGYDSTTPVGKGINFLASVSAVGDNNIFYGLTTGVNHSTSTQQTIFLDYCNFFGNTTDRTNIDAGTNDIALDPEFKGITQRGGTTATTTAGNHLVDTTATFVTWGITAGTHYLYLASGTGPTTARIYTILSVDSETQITTLETLAADATADKTWYITTGFNWAVGTNMKGVGTPGAMQGNASPTISYQDIGAAQREEDYPVISNVTTGIVYSNGELTGALPPEVWSTITAAQIKSGVNQIQNSTTITGTYLWDTIPASDIRNTVNHIQDGVTFTGSFAGETWTTITASQILLGVSQIQNGSTVTGTLNVPVAMSGTAGTVDIANIKENIRAILHSNNTSTGAPVSDLSNAMSNRVKDVFKIHPEKILIGGHQMPAITTYLTSKTISAKTIAANQVAAKREADLVFSIVGMVTNQIVPNTYTSDALDDDIEYLMENVENILRNYGDIAGYTRWSFPNNVTYHSSSLDERNHLRIGILDLNCKVFY